MEEVRALATIARVSRSECQFAGILPTKVDLRTNETQDQLLNLAQAFQEQVWPVIPKDDKCRLAQRAGKTLWEAHPECRALNGVEMNGRLRGGYRQALGRLLELVE